MGGIGSGGLNKTHKQEEKYRFCKIDSFAFSNYVKGDKYLYYKSEIKYPAAGEAIIYHVHTKTASIEYDGYRYPLELSRVANIDGRSIRVYFICPSCGKRVRYLYKKDNGIRCRTCSELNYASQQKSGMEEVLHKMQDVVENKLQYSHWKLENPYSLHELYIPKPRYMRWRKYNELIREYKQLQEEYYGYELKMLSKFFKYM